MPKPLRVVLVAGSEEDASAMAAALQRAGFEPTIERVESQEALSRALTESVPDVVLAEAAVPGCDASRALALVRQQRPEVPFLVVTHAASRRVAVECLKEGAWDYILKESLETLGTAVADALEHAPRSTASAAARTPGFDCFALLPIAVLQIDASGRILRSNPSAHRLTGLGCDELAGKTLRDLVPSYEHEMLSGALAQLQANGHVSVELAFRRPEADKVEVRCEAVRVEAGGFLAFCTDITASRRVESAWRAAESRYRAFFDSCPDFVFLKDSSLRYLYANRAYLHWLGRSEAEVVGRTDAELMPPELAASCRRSDRAALAANRPVTGEESADDKVFDVVKFPVALEQGGVGVGAFIRDVTERRAADEARKRAEAALRSSEERYRSLFEYLPIGLYRTSPDGRIHMANEALVRMLGFASFEDLAARKLEREGFERKTPRSTFTAILEHEGSVHGLESTWTRADGTPLCVREWARVVRAADGGIEAYEGVVEDVSEHKRLQQQLLQAQKMEAVGRLAGGVAHDFNNLLQAMLSLLEVLRRRNHDPGRVAAIAEELGQHIKRGASLTRQLLLFSRQETAKPEKLDLRQLVSESARLLSRLLPENIALSIEPGERPLRVTADRGQLEQLLMNLAVNAADAMPKGGSLTVRCSAAEPDAVTVEVEDTGVGMPPTMLQRIFEPFFTTKPAGKGTGLGLAVVHGIVTQHGGRIEVTSQEGVGTRFKITFPARYSGEFPRLDPSQLPAQPLARGRGERVLVVEDEPGARQGLVDLLDVLGYQPFAVGSGEEALQQPLRPGFDVLITDLMLPGISGADLAMALAERWPALKVILMSGYTEDQYVKLGAFAGVVRFLQKPFDAETLAQELRRTLDDRNG